MTPSNRTSVRDDGRHRVLVIGTGSIGQRHVRCFLGTNRAQVGICELNDELRNKVASECNVSDYSILDEALNEPWDSAVIATPAHTHIRLAQQLVEHRIPTLLEKPLSASLDGVEPLVNSAKQHDVPLSVAYVLRCHPVIEAMKKAVMAKAVGSIVQALFVSGQHFPTYRPAYRETYYVDHQTGGGAIQDALTHLLDASQFLLGPIDSLASDADHLRLEDVEVEDSVHVMARQAGIMSMFSLNQHQAPNETVITLIGTEGTLRGELHSRKISTMTSPESQWEVQTVAPFQRDDLFVKQANRFLDFVTSRGENPCSVSEGARSLKAALAILHNAGRSMIDLDST